MNKLVRAFLFIVSAFLILLAISSFVYMSSYRDLGYSMEPEEALGYFILAFMFGVPGFQLFKIARRGYFFKPESEKTPIIYEISKTFSLVFFVMSVLSFILTSVDGFASVFLPFAGISFLLAIVSAIPYFKIKESIESEKYFKHYLEYLKTYFSNETVEKIKKLNEAIPIKPQIALLDPDEDVRMKGYASIVYLPMSYPPPYFFKLFFPKLYLTNKRLIIESNIGKSDNPYVVLLEEITGMTLTKYLSDIEHISESYIDADTGEYVERIIDVSRFMNTPPFMDISPFAAIRIYFKPHDGKKSLSAIIITHEAEKWKEEIDKLRKERIEELELKEKVVIDFSTIRNYFSEKGLVVYTVKCPNCGAPLKLPEKGKEIKCEYCGTTVYAEDILKKLKII